MSRCSRPSTAESWKEFFHSYAERISMIDWNEDFIDELRGITPPIVPDYVWSDIQVRHLPIIEKA